jgi:hypothetical protein
MCLYGRGSLQAVMCLLVGVGGKQLCDFQLGGWWKALMCPSGRGWW